MSLSIEDGAALLRDVRTAVATRIVGQDAAIEDALVFNAFSSEYIAHLLESRARTTPAQMSPLFLTRRADLLELELPAPDLSIYEVDPHE